MRRTTLLALAAILASTTALAQGVVVQEPHQTMIGTTIIREVDYPATITCTYNYLNDSTLTFIYSDATMTTKEATIKGYRVSDMVVTKDSVFFCGTEYFNVQPMGAIEETEPFENTDNNSEIITPEIIRKRYPLYKECETN